MESKFLCVMGLFDDKTNQIFKNLENGLKDQGFQKEEICPHITLGIYVGLEEKKLLTWVDEFSKKYEAPEIKFNHIGVFGTTICYAAPRVDKKLLGYHEKLHEKYDHFSGEVGFNFSVKSKNWVPHATLAMGEPTAIKPLIPYLCESFSPFTAKLTQLSVCEFYPMKEISVFDLKGYYQRKVM